MASATKAAASKSVKKAQPTAGTRARTGKVPATRAAASSAKKAPATTGKRAASTSVPARAPRSASRPSGAQSSAKSGTKKAQTAVRKAATKETVKKSVTTSTTRTTEKPEKKKAAVAAKAPSRAQKAAAAPSPAARRDGAKPSPRKAAARTPAGPYAGDQKFLAEQRQLLESERAIYQGQASDLKAEADSLAQEREPGDVQFDEESGEGGTVTVDRERDLALSAQALAAVDEIDLALARIQDGSYGACERCHQPIPKPRLKALPFARLCVACKSGGLSRR